MKKWLLMLTVGFLLATSSVSAQTTHSFDEGTNHGLVNGRIDVRAVASHLSSQLGNDAVLANQGSKGWELYFAELLAEGHDIQEVTDEVNAVINDLVYEARLEATSLSLAKRSSKSVEKTTFAMGDALIKVAAEFGHTLICEIVETEIGGIPTKVDPLVVIL
ncbi:MAG: hypothetical protein ACRDBX_06955 [Erysipelotrichaceae bacterium]